MSRAVPILVVPIVVLATATARAQTDEPTTTALPLVQPAQPPADDIVTSYRPWTMTADAISLGTIIGGFAMPGTHVHDTSDAIITAGLLGGFLATPIMHAARGHRTRALGSFVLRGFAAGAGAMIGVATAECGTGQWLCGLDRMGPGMVAGLALAMAIDNIWLTDERAPRPHATQTAWTPVLAPRPGGGTLGVAASW